MIVSENEDGHPWNADADTDDIVLVHWSRADPTPRFVDTIGPTGLHPPGASPDRRCSSPPRRRDDGARSNICYVSTTSPLTPAPVPTTFAGAPLEAQILGVDEGLVFLGVLETATTGRLEQRHDARR
jgi:hypothetical protein